MAPPAPCLACPADPGYGSFQLYIFFFDKRRLPLTPGNTLPYPLQKGRWPSGFIAKTPLWVQGGQTVKKSFREVWRAEALQMQGESGDMCGGFANLRSKVSLRRFPPGSPMGARGKRRKSRKRTPQADFFDTP